MLSLIICARSGDIPASLRQNITDTIGAVFEIIVIDNADNQHSIFSAYNWGVKQSKYPYLCFMHDDIIFHTQNWGNSAIHHFNDNGTGAIGIAGSPFFPAMPAAWWSTKTRNEITVGCQGGAIMPLVHYYQAVTDKNECVVLDGVWFCIRKSLFEKIKFDETVFSGFHFYDIDICLQVRQSGYKLYCVYDIWIQHLSIGNTNRAWMKNALLLQKKWQQQLPATCMKFNYLQVCKFELRALNEYLDVLLRNDVPKKEVYKTAAVQLAMFWKGYFYYQTPYYIYKYLVKIANYGKN